MSAVPVGADLQWIATGRAGRDRYTAPVTGQLSIVHVLEKNRLTTGSVVQMMEAARGLAARGHRVTVVSRAGGDLEKACTDAGVPLLTLPLRYLYECSRC